MPFWGAFSFQDAVSPLMNWLTAFHDHVMVILVGIVFLVGYIMSQMMLGSSLYRGLLESHALELLWTLTPVFVLVYIAFPSLKALYLLDELPQSCLSLRITGHQWYWSYEYSDFLGWGLDSYMSNSDFCRLLSVDGGLSFPIGLFVRSVGTSEDVIHSWTVPSVGLKMDVVPGRLNQGFIFMQSAGQYYGQCSEICGANHSFMPILLEGISVKTFIKVV